MYYVVGQESLKDLSAQLYDAEYLHTHLRLTTSPKQCSNNSYDYGWFALSRMWMPGGCSL